MSHDENVVTRARDTRHRILALEALLERGREEGQIRTDVPLSTLVESLLALVAASVRTGRAAGMGLEDMSSTALQLLPAPTD